MVTSYIFTEPSNYHQIHNIPNQDHSFVMQKGALWAVAVADGVGSQRNGGLGARVAAEVSVRRLMKAVFREFGHMSEEEKKSALRKALEQADEDVQTIGKLIRKDDRKPELAQFFDSDGCDTTLMLVLYDEERGELFFANAGDSGLLVQTMDGKYEAPCIRGEDAEGYLYPLRDRSHWQFGKIANVCGAVLMTDGIYDKVVPLMRSREAVPIDLKLAEALLNHYEDGTISNEEYYLGVNDALRRTPLLDDDRTFVTMINTGLQPARQPDEYYEQESEEEILKRIIGYFYATTNEGKEGKIIPVMRPKKKSKNPFAKKHS